jgi:alpha-mannosidase
MKKVTFALTLLMVFVSSALKAQVYTGISQWLVAGSFCDKSLTDQHAKSFFSEAVAAPKAGEMAGTNLWKIIPNHTLDFTATGFADNGNAAAYAFAYIYSKEDQLAAILLGSDDGNIVWLNGLKVWEKVAKRPMLENEDRIEVQLSKGYNRLLIKIDQGDGGWGMICNMASSQVVEIGTDRPAPEEMAKGKELAIVGSSISMKDKNAVINLKISNFGKTSVANAKCTIFDASSVKVAEKTQKEIKPSEMSAIAFELPLKKAIQILSAGNNLAVVVSGDNKNSILLPNSLAMDLFIALSRNSAFADAETQTMSRQLDFVLDVYGARTDLSPMAIKGLGYVAEGKNEYIKSIIQVMYQDAAKNAPDLSKDTIHIIGHAHMDMNWLWPYPETRKMMHDNFRQVIALMDKYPDYTMLQSQVTIYKHIEKMDPPLFEGVKKYVKQGRFEPVGGMWSEGDCNLSGGEALCRSFLLGQRFLNERFGRMARVGWLPDNFGHISQFPQILNLVGINYYYFMRCNPYAGTFWWVGPDSSKVLCFSGIGYGNSISPGIKNEVNTVSPVKRRIFYPTGVGDHGGGPTIADINMAHKLDSTPRFAAVKFTTAERFFKASSKEMDGRPTHRGEMQFIFEGCYTSIAEIKENTRRSEQALYKTEFLSSLRWLYGESYPAADLKDMWETVAYNQFHDILPGSAIYESYQDAVADHKGVQKKANEITEAAFLHLADEITFKTGMGQPIVVLNMQPRGKKVLVEAEIFTHEEPATAVLSSWGDYYSFNNIKLKPGNKTATVIVRDAAGKTYPAQIIGGKMFPPGFRTCVEFVVDNMPAGGYRTFYVDASKPGASAQPITEKDGKFETDFFIVAFDMKTGDITQLKDKRTGKDYVSANGRLNKLQMYMEAPNGMNAWTIGEIKEIQDVKDVESVNIVESGPVRATVEVVKKWGRSKFIQRTYIYKSYPRIDFDLDAHWFEVGDGNKPTNPFLKTTFDLAIANPEFDNHVPFDVVKRPVNGQEVPAQQWVDVTDRKTGIALLNTTKFGHSFDKGQLRLSLLRATYSPDIYPNIGVNHIRYSLYPHAGDWKNGVWAEAENFNVPVYASEPPSLALVKAHATRPAEDSLLIVSPSTVVMSGIKQAEDGKNLIVRLIEVYGKETVASVKLPVAAKSASRVNIIELPQETGDKPVVAGKKVSVKLRPHEIVTLSIKMTD